jgi:hypothetical protein
MNAPFHEAKALSNLTCPAAIEALVAIPLLLPGESLENYQTLRLAIFAEIAPRSTIEWLLAIDIVELCWEIQRYRLLRHKILETSRQRAVACFLSQIDLVGISSDRREVARRHTELNAHAWRSDADVKMEIEQRLSSHGIDQSAINAEAHVQTREPYLMFETLMVAAQQRRTMLLREINNHRYSSSRSGDGFRRAKLC